MLLLRRCYGSTCIMFHMLIIPFVKPWTMFIHLCSINQTRGNSDSEIIILDWFRLKFRNQNSSKWKQWNWIWNIICFSGIVLYECNITGIDFTIPLFYFGLLMWKYLPVVPCTYKLIQCMEKNHVICNFQLHLPK